MNLLDEIDMLKKDLSDAQAKIAELERELAVQAVSVDRLLAENYELIAERDALRADAEW